MADSIPLFFLHIDLTNCTSKAHTFQCTRPGHTYQEVCDYFLAKETRTFTNVLIVTYVGVSKILADWSRPVRDGIIIIRTGEYTNNTVSSRRQRDTQDLDGCMICLLKTRERVVGYCHKLHTSCYKRFSANNQNELCPLLWCNFNLSGHMCTTCDTLMLSGYANSCCGPMTHYSCLPKKFKDVEFIIDPRACRFFKKTQTQPESLSTLCKYAGMEVDRMDVLVNVIYKGLEVHQNQINIQYAFTEDTTLADFMKLHFPTLSIDTTRVAIGELFMAFDSWGRVNLRACFEWGLKTFNIRIGFGTKKYLRLSEKGTPISARSTCSCGVTSNKILYPGIYRKKSLCVDCDKCKKPGDPRFTMVDHCWVQHITHEFTGSEWVSTRSICGRVQALLYANGSEKFFNMIHHSILISATWHHRDDRDYSAIQYAECALCLSSPTKSSNYICHHGLCDSCIFIWKDKTCALCRSELVLEDNPYVLRE